MRRFFSFFLALLISGNALPQDYSQVREAFRQEGYVVVSPGGIATCFQSACYANRLFLQNGQVYSQLYYVEGTGGLNAHLTPVGEPHAPQVVEMGGERIGVVPNQSGVKINAPPADAGESSSIQFTTSVPEPDNLKQDIPAKKPSGGFDGRVLAGRALFAIFSSYATIGNLPNNRAVIAQRMNEVQARLRNAELNSEEMTRFASQLVGAGVEIPPSLRMQMQKSVDAHGGESKHLVQLSSLSTVREYQFSKEDLRSLSDALKSGDLKRIAEQSEQIVSAYAQGGAIQKTVAPYVNESGVIVPSKIDPKFSAAPFDHYKLETSPRTVHGRLIRRAIDKTQLAWAQEQSLGKGLAATHPSLYGTTELLKIADARFAAGAAQIGPEAIAQAEGFAYVSEKIAEGALGFTDGAYDSIVQMADAIESIPKLGREFIDFSESALHNPRWATQKMWTVLGKTPEFVRHVYNGLVAEVKRFPTLSTREKFKVVGKLTTDALITHGAGKALTIAKDVEILENSVQVADRFAETFGEKATHVAEALGQDAKEAETWVPKFGSKYAEAWGDLDERYLKEFTPGTLEKSVVKPGRHLLQYQVNDQLGPGRWYTSLLADSRQGAEDIVQTFRFKGTLPENVKVFRVLEETGVWTGGVKDGIGTQIFFNHSVPLKDVIKEIPGAAYKY